MGLLMKFGQHHHIPRQLYRFRQHNQYKRAGRIGGPELFRQAQKAIAPILLDLHRQGVKQADDAG